MIQLFRLRPEVRIHFCLPLTTLRGLFWVHWGFGNAVQVHCEQIDLTFASCWTSRGASVCLFRKVTHLVSCHEVQKPAQGPSLLLSTVLSSSTRCRPLWAWTPFTSCTLLALILHLQGREGPVPFLTQHKGHDLFSITEDRITGKQPNLVI